MNKNINEIKINDNTIIKDQKEILNELKNFYENLYNATRTENETNYSPDITPNKITNKERDALELPINKKELDTALKRIKNNKSSGLDGYSPELKKKFGQY